MTERSLLHLQFGNLKALRQIRIEGRLYWECLCVCGKSRLVPTSKLTSGHTRSCGCLRLKHGMEGSPEYAAWGNMLYRCNNPRAAAYPLYGGRGIKVSPDWLNFRQFYADMGPRPSKFHSLERKDNNKGYSADNCIWSNSQAQNRNRRTSRLVEIQGVSGCIAEVARYFGISPNTLRKRLNRGLTGDRLIIKGISR